MSILVALLRNDFVALISDSRLTDLQGNILSENAPKIIRLDKGVIIGVAGRQLTINSVLNKILLDARDMWPKQYLSLTDHVSIIKNAIAEIKNLPQNQNNPLRMAAGFLAGKQNGTFELYGFCTYGPNNIQRITATEELQVYVRPPAGATQADYEKEFLSVLRQRNLQTSGADPDELIDVCIEAVQKLAGQNQYINNIPQIQVVS